MKRRDAAFSRTLSTLLRDLNCDWKQHAFELISMHAASGDKIPVINPVTSLKDSLSAVAAPEPSEKLQEETIADQLVSEKGSVVISKKSAVAHSTQRIDVASSKKQNVAAS